MFDVIFSSRKDETTKICAKHFVVSSFRVFVIHILTNHRQPATAYLLH